MTDTVFPAHISGLDTALLLLEDADNLLLAEPAFHAFLLLFNQRIHAQVWHTFRGLRHYGYDNAGDEAVLAVPLDHVSAQSPRAEFVVTPGAPSQTAARHACAEYSLRVVARDDFKALWREMKSCDAFLSGGGSLLQDATSLRNVIYYTALIRMAHAAKKPAMIYAQGIGPLQRNISKKLTRAALQSRSTRVVTLCDPDSKTLFNSIGVTREIEITGKPVWALRLNDEHRTPNVEHDV